ncbi:hypothetical protein DFQ28_007423 [Apophysomyces sp. BC1034]|nr:hypothetical protein DFQ30_007970 [Apophysomyces sp. BC1015]KAG0176282.1 hypothetical protein DFQ29_006328 [Apophysomyces sp. BC1021]KAG0186689.1 hypothetical protein DFQ28_007423 [Apophysomyces sp. BC1034]
MSAKIVSTIQGTFSKLVAAQRPLIYKAKVAGEIAKQVYIKEGMAFPTGEQFAQAQQTIKQSANVSALKQNFSWRCVAQGGVVAAELYTFFLIGEIIGRRNLIGYNVESAEPKHH